MDALNFLLIALTGVLVGFLGGMFGFGGSSLSTPLLRIFFNIPPYFALASPLPMTLLSSLISSSKYQREGLIDWEVVKEMSPMLILGSFLGAYLTKYVGGKILMLLTALFLIYVAFRYLLGQRYERRKAGSAVILTAGFFIGLLSGMLANGGGILIVPILTFMGLHLKKGIGTSLAMVFLVSIPSILVHWYLGHIDWWLTLALTAGAMPGAYMGSHITIAMSKDKLRKAYGIFLLLFAMYFALFEILRG